MKKDIFDNGLREKLGNARSEPPSDMWDRIAATLKEQGLTAAEPVAGVPVRTPVVRRMRQLVGYAAAAAILIGAIIFGVNRIHSDRTLIAEEIIEEQPPLTEIVTKREVEHAGQPIDPIDGDAVSKIQAVDVRVERKGVETVSSPAPSTVVPPIMKDVDTPTVTVQSVINTDTDTKRQWMEQGEIERMLKDAGRGRRKSKSVVLGLYSSSIGGDESEKKVRRTPYASLQSDFVVNEYSDGAYNLSASNNNTTNLKHRLPLTVGVSVAKEVADRLSLESGVTYSYLLSKSESPSSNGGTYNIKQELHYVGVPIGVKYDLLRSRNIDLYSSVSGLFEMCVSSKRKIYMKNGDVSGDSKTESLNVRGIQPSVAAYAGAEVKLSKNLGIYVEPGVSYYFDIEKQPESYRTENLLNFSFRAGLRISL